jgi:hypothetical protein
MTIWSVDKPANGNNLFSNGQPVYVSTDGLNGRPPATGASVQGKIWPSISKLSWRPAAQAGGISILAFANSADGTPGSGQDYMSTDAAVQNLNNAVRFWCFQ